MVALPVVRRVNVQPVPREMAVQFHPADSAGRPAGHPLLGLRRIAQVPVPRGGNGVDALLAADLRVRLEPGAVTVRVPPEGVAPLALVHADQHAEARLLALAQRQEVVDDLEVGPLVDGVLGDRVAQEQAVLGRAVHEPHAHVGHIRRHGVGDRLAAVEQADHGNQGGAVLRLDGPAVGQSVADLEGLLPPQTDDRVTHRRPQVQVWQGQQPGEPDLPVRPAGLADIGIPLQTGLIHLVVQADDETGALELLVEDQPAAALALSPINDLNRTRRMEVVEDLAREHVLDANPPDHAEARAVTLAAVTASVAVDHRVDLPGGGIDADLQGGIRQGVRFGTLWLGRGLHFRHLFLFRCSPATSATTGTGGTTGAILPSSRIFSTTAWRLGRERSPLGPMNPPMGPLPLVAVSKWQVYTGAAARMGVQTKRHQPAGAA
jgi:hypothetical protein